jgi:hypothetical protein
VVGEERDFVEMFSIKMDSIFVISKGVFFLPADPLKIFFNENFDDFAS